MEDDYIELRVTLPDGTPFVRRYCVEPGPTGSPFLRSDLTLDIDVPIEVLKYVFDHKLGQLGLKPFVPKV